MCGRRTTCRPILADPNSDRVSEGPFSEETPVAEIREQVAAEVGSAALAQSDWHELRNAAASAKAGAGAPGLFV